MKNESVKRSLEKSENVLEEKRKVVKEKICIKKTNTFTIIDMNSVQEQLKSGEKNTIMVTERKFCRNRQESGAKKG